MSSLGDLIEDMNRGIKSLQRESRDESYPKAKCSDPLSIKGFGTVVVSFGKVSDIKAGSLPMAALSSKLDSKILIVDGNRDALSAMSNLLEKQKFSVTTAQNGWEALNRLKVDDHISLVVLLSLSMPVMDGREFLRRKRSDPRIAEVPVIAISASSSGALEGVEEVLMKPDPIDAFVDAVRRHVFKKGA